MSETPVWTDERLKKLKDLWNKGLSISQIGEELDVSRNAIAGKVYRLGLPKRQSPISTKSAPKKPAPVAEVAEQIDTSECRLSSPCAASTGHAANVPGRMVTRRPQPFRSAARMSCPASPIATNIALRPIRQAVKAAVPEPWLPALSFALITLPLTMPSIRLI